MLLAPVDVCVIGAGTSGAAAAAFLAEAGLRVACLDRRAIELAGARWVNGLPRAAFRDAGVPLPEPGEYLGGPTAFHMVAPGGRVVVDGHDLIEVDMRKLVARLQARAAAAGATLIGGVSVLGRDGDLLLTSRGDLQARWFIDASGLGGVRLLDQAPVAREDICVAAQEVREVVDRDAARAFFDGHGVKPGEVLGLVGVAGGYSVLNVRLHEHGETMGILTGSIPALGFPAGKAILDEFVAAQPWIGQKVFGGGGAIPLRRAHDRLASDDDRVALLGDAGCQVFPAHGSGIGSGMIAARMLADTIARGAPLRAYEVAWQRSHGGLFALFDAVRRWNQRQDAEALGRVLGGGLADEALLRAGIDQTFPRPSLAGLPAKARALFAHPALARDLVGTVARSAALKTLYATYPRRADRVPAWSRLVSLLTS